MAIDLPELKQFLHELDEFKEMLVSDTESAVKHRNPVNLYPILKNYLQEFANLQNKYQNVCTQILECKSLVQPKSIDPETGKYPEYIMQDVRYNIGLDEDDTSRDEEIMSMPRDKVLNHVMEYDGLINYGVKVHDWVEDIYGVDLLELPERERPQLSTVNDLVTNAQSKKSGPSAIDAMLKFKDEFTQTPPDTSSSAPLFTPDWDKLAQQLRENNKKDKDIIL